MNDKVYELTNPYEGWCDKLYPYQKFNSTKRGFNKKEIDKRRKKNKMKKTHRNGKRRH